MRSLTNNRLSTVSFQFGRPAEGPMTLGQLNIMEWLDRVDEPLYATNMAVLDLPAGVGVADVAQALHVLLGRHESLRTTYPNGERRQCVASAGELPIVICDVADGADPTAPAVLAELRELSAVKGPVPRTELPVYAVLAVHDGSARAGVLCCSHLAVDNEATRILEREFAEVIRDAARQGVGGRRHQPLDQAERERTPLVRRRAQAALENWRDNLAWMPRCLFALPRVGTSGESLALEMSSPSAASALDRLTTRTRTSRTSAVFAALCALTAEYLGQNDFAFTTMAGNRFDDGLDRYIGTLAQSCIVPIRTGAADTFDAFVRQTWAVVVRATRRGQYDVYRRVELARELEHERGVVFDYEPLFNGTAVETPGADGGAPHGSTTLEWSPMGPAKYPDSPTLVRFDLFEVVGRLRLRLLSWDTSRMPSQTMEGLLRAAERLLLAAADTDLTAAQVSAALDVRPVERGPGWRLVDSCWIEVAEVRRLVADAVAPGAAAVFTDVDGHAVVAYVAATETVTTAREAHLRCMALLAGRPTAVAPQHYVVFAQAPSDPQDRGGWRGPVDSGSGR